LSYEPPRAGPDVILTPDQRIRVFISSTLEELASERVAARRAIQRLRLRLLWENSAWETDVVVVGGEPRAVTQPEETPIRVSEPAGA